MIQKRAKGETSQTSLDMESSDSNLGITFNENSSLHMIWSSTGLIFVIILCRPVTLSACCYCVKATTTKILIGLNEKFDFDRVETFPFQLRIFSTNFSCCFTVP